MKSKELEVIKNAMDYAIELFEDNDLKPTKQMFKAVKLIEKEQEKTKG